MKTSNKQSIPDKSFNTDYLYNSFLPYFEALHMARWLTRLCDISRRLQKRGPIAENVADAASHSARIFNPDMRPPGTSPEEFDQMRERETKLKTMTPEEKDEFLQNEWKEVEEKINSGEIDLWDDTPIFSDPAEVKRFLRESVDYLRKKVCIAANPSTSFLEGALLETVEALEADQTQPLAQRTVRAYQCLLTVWDTARMAQEGRPPYQIKFSPQVADALGIDPVVEESRMATEYSLPASFVRHSLVAAKIAKAYLPEYNKELSALVKKLSQTKKRE